MTYDIHGKWNPTTGHNAPFCWDTRPGNPAMHKSVEGAVETMLAAGCPAHKVFDIVHLRMVPFSLSEGG